MKREEKKAGEKTQTGQTRRANERQKPRLICRWLPGSSLQAAASRGMGPPGCFEDPSVGPLVHHATAGACCCYATGTVHSVSPSSFILVLLYGWNLGRRFGFSQPARKWSLFFGATCKLEKLAFARDGLTVWRSSLAGPAVARAESLHFSF